MKQSIIVLFVIMERIEHFWNLILEKTAVFGPLEWSMAAVAGLCLVSLPILLSSGRQRRKPLPAVPMHVAFHSFQIAPLGRDALLRIQNTRDGVVLLGAAIKGSREIAVKNALSGHELEPDKIYGILLEATGKDRMLPDFEFVLTYMDARRNVFRQSFFPELRGAKPPKRIRKA